MTIKRYLAALAAAILACAFSLSAADVEGPGVVKVSGKIIDEAGVPVIGIAVIASDGSNGTITNEDGLFYITVPEGDVLTVTGIGYQDEKVALDGRTELLIRMKTDTVLEEAVLVGFGTQKKESVIGAIASIAPETLATNQTANLSNALAGQIAGVIGVQRSGEPGYDASDFWIRGINTFGASSNPLVIVDGVERSLDQLSPEEIESFSVLKDASATAIYGVRGANGAIVIKTKRGSVGKAKVNIKADYGVTTPLKIAEFVDGAKHMEVVNAAAELSGMSHPFSPLQIQNTRDGVDPDLYPSTDWLDLVTNDFATNAHISTDISGGTELLRYRFILGVYNESGIIATDPGAAFDSELKLTKYNVRSNIDLNLTKSTLFTFSLGGYMQDRHAPGSNVSSILQYALEIPPIVHPAVYSNGKFPIQSNRANPYVMATQTGYKDNYKSQLQSVATLDQDFGMLWEPLQGLHAKVTFSFDVYQDYWSERTRRPTYYYATGRDEQTGELIMEIVSTGDEFLGFSKSFGGSRSTYFEVPVSYNRTFEKHTVDALLLWNMRSHVDQNASSAIYSFPYRHAGLAGRMAYDYDSRYFAEFNFGYNGSENFAKKYRYGFFPSGAIGWMVSNEPWMEGTKHIINQLRVRGSMGIAGNDQISGGRRFGYLTTINGNAGGHSFGDNNSVSYPGVAEDQFGVPDLTWETATKTNIGFDLGLFDALSLTVDYFTEVRKDIFMQRKIFPETSGFQNAPYANYGKVFNRGVDASLTFNKAFTRDTYLSVMANFTYAHNTILEYDEAAGIVGTTRARTGHGINQNFGLQSLGLYAEDDFLDPVSGTLKPGLPIPSWGKVLPGDIKYADLTNDGKINDEDVTAIGGSSVPEIVYGFGFSFRHKGFDISALFQGVALTDFVVGGDYDDARNQYYIPGAGSGAVANILGNVDDRWTPENPSQDVFWPRLSLGVNENNSQSSSWWLKNGAFLRLKNFEMGYTFLRKGMGKDRVMNNMRIFVRGTNLFTISEFDLWDPELSGYGFAAYPISRVVSVGVDFSFN